MASAETSCRMSEQGTEAPSVWECDVTPNWACKSCVDVDQTLARPLACISADESRKKNRLCSGKESPTAIHRGVVFVSRTWALFTGVIVQRYD